jgi:predicted anti-sigma-YlaC factor YlaD
MTCKRFEHRLAELEDYLNGEAPNIAAIEEHLGGCTACRQAMEEARLAGALLREALEPAPEASAAFWTRLGTRLRDAEAGQRPEMDFWGAMEAFSRRLAVSAAAMVLVVAGLLVGAGVFEGVLRPVKQPEIRELVQRPAPPANHEEVLLSLAAENAGSERTRGSGR